ncbi:unnamed protein product [Rotaria magnacalcarata]|uniref:Uncharacterized protein n=3 Tax=Rotaria magnacalcarata TaxID=392030 RepID=A0A819J054_9BILA|nr:unnamed protein product [Rotaria magnacalcarata]CAF2139308.1 unnamed protein product [Rotaria magnacalcarata]CAF3839881.1 unnamed protein product [Rotaria magnacalcarata]CAF3922347.1 unnamed protein product [Rotaria magnacalcarata]CAF4041272.1 unnamed protein product [Rotaria magnacalcarata]
MKKLRSMQRYSTEKAIIDALLKISEIIKRTTQTSQHPKKATDDGNKKQSKYDYDCQETYNRLIPSAVRTLDYHVLDSNQQYTTCSSQRSSNFNRAPISQWDSRPYDKRYYSVSKQRINNDYRDRTLTRPHYDETPSPRSSLLDNQYRRRSSRFHSKHKVSRYDKRRCIHCKCYRSNGYNESDASDC